MSPNPGDTVITVFFQQCPHLLKSIKKMYNIYTDLN